MGSGLGGLVGVTITGQVWVGSVRSPMVAGCQPWPAGSLPQMTPAARVETVKRAIFSMAAVGVKMEAG